jgi:acyl-ACP thioesterase
MSDYIYEKSYDITTNMLDSDDYLKESAILDLCQDIASRHSVILGIGYEDLIKRDLIWVIVRSKIDNISKVKDPKKVNVKTYFLDKEFIYYPREITISSEGVTITNVKTLWLIYDLKSKAIAEDLKGLTIPDTKVAPKLPRLRKLLIQNDRESFTYVSSVKVVNSEIDHNKHLNNTHYLDFFLDSVPLEINSEIKSLQCEYVKQAFLGDTLDLYIKKDEGNDLFFDVFKGNDVIFYLKASL